LKIIILKKHQGIQDPAVERIDQAWKVYEKGKGHSCGNASTEDERLNHAMIFKITCLLYII
jgi:hypothetical protein